MNGNPYFCRSPGRVTALREAAQAVPPRLLNGIHYLEVAPGQRRLRLHFVHSLALVPAAALSAGNVEIRGGVRVRDPQVIAVSSAADVLTVEVSTPGDFSPYVLRLVAGAGGGAPPAGIDPALAQVEFSFKVDCPSDFDCRTEDACPPVLPRPQVIDYLARDYTSFRRLLLDRMAALMPAWRERSPADAWVALAEAVAFRADEIAYFQDAVATEAYLGTARQRVSVKRHTRLLDYAFHDGSNARTWVAFEVEAAADGQTLPGCDPHSGIGGCQLLTRTTGLPAAIDADAAQVALGAGALAFELLHDLVLFSAHNRIGLHLWSDEECCLPRGATRAFLRDDGPRPLQLVAGDVLVLEALRSEVSGQAADADRSRRWAVRLTSVQPLRDPVTDQALVEVHWSPADALPFALCLSKRIDGALVGDMACAVGNVALADHGHTLARAETLAPLPGGRVPRYPLDYTAVAPLTQQARVRTAGRETTQLVDTEASASAALQTDLDDVRAALDLRSLGDRRRWSAQRDLLGSGAQSDDFVVETEDAGRAVLRFGDGVNGRRPPPSEVLSARLRVGSGSAGNIGAEAIGHVVSGVGGISAITAVRNPLPARGGVDAQPLREATLYAPQAFRRQERAVTVDDYAQLMQGQPQVQRALATRRWTGSWHTVFISVDRRGSGLVDADFEDRLRGFIERYRLAGHDVEIDGPHYVALDVELHVCARPGYFEADVARRLQAALTALFHPDRHSFGDPVYASELVAAAMQVAGVAHVTLTRFQRLGRSSAGEIDSGRITMARLEIARLDNDPNAPEHGRLQLDVHTTAPA